MTRVMQLHQPTQYDEAPVDLMPYMEQLQTSLTLMARAVLQLDKRVTHLESQVAHIVRAKEDNSWRHSNGASWGRHS